MNELNVIGRCAYPPTACWSAKHRCLQARYAHILSIALAVFGSRKKAQRWLGGTAVRLGHQSPCTLLCTSGGYAGAQEELSRLDHGICARYWGLQ